MVTAKRARALRKLYCEQGKSLRDIAALYRTTASTVHRWMDEAGIERRGPGRQPVDLDALVPLQHALLDAAIGAARPGGVIAYVTCSPHRRETTEVVESAEGVEVVDASSVLPEVPDAARGPYLQLWPHRHGTDAMFLALLRKR